jgi:hypothetical protein
MNLVASELADIVVSASAPLPAIAKPLSLLKFRTIRSLRYSQTELTLSLDFTLDESLAPYCPS